MQPLYEMLRPSCLADVLGQPKAVAIAQRYIDKGIGGRTFWVSGTSGIGKTTIARILAGSIANPLYIAEIVGRDLTASALRDISDGMHYYGAGADGKNGRALIINEAHGLTRAAIEKLLDITENLPAHFVIIFTTTRDGQESLFEDQIDAGPLLSRCVKLPLTNQGLAKSLAPRLAAIARELGLDGQPESAYVKLMHSCGNNVRAAITAIENGEMLAGE